MPLQTSPGHLGSARSASSRKTLKEALTSVGFCNRSVNDWAERRQGEAERGSSPLKNLLSAPYLLLLCLRVPDEGESR